jgi:Spy/CpxP family protein refolding chaperone
MTRSLPRSAPRRYWPFAALALAASAALGAGCAHRPPESRDAKAEKVHKYVTFRVDDVLDDLDASAEQRTRVHGVKDKLLTDALAMRKKMRESHGELLAAWRSDKPDAGAIHALVDKRVEELRLLLHGAADGLIEVHAALSPEQREELAEKIEERMQHRH